MNTSSEKYHEFVAYHKKYTSLEGKAKTKYKSDFCYELDEYHKAYKKGSLRNVGVVKSICKQVQTAAYQCSNHGISATGWFISHGYSFFRNRVSFVNWSAYVSYAVDLMIGLRSVVLAIHLIGIE